MIEFRKITEFPRGTLISLLMDAYSFEPGFQRDHMTEWQQEFDDFFFDHPSIAETCGFMTVLDGTPIGFVTWNPTNFPEVEIGHNCVSAAHKGKGYGRLQMQEAVDRIAAKGAEKILVTTSERLIPAQRMYESVGFVFVDKSEEPVGAEYAGMRMNYEMRCRL